MGNVKIVLNGEGIRSMLRSDEMMRVCEEQAQKAVKKLGPGYEVSTHVGKTRVNASIAAVTSEAIQENYENNTILKALR